MNAIRFSARLIVGLLVLAFAPCGCSEPPAAPATSPIDLAYRNLASWSGLRGSGHPMLADDVAKTAAKDLSVDNALVQLSPGGELILISHINWSVAISLLRPDLSVVQVRAFPAKCGFTVTWYNGLVVILNEHPGTGMFYKEPVRVTVEAGELVVRRVEGQERKEFLEYVTYQSS